MKLPLTAALGVLLSASSVFAQVSADRALATMQVNDPELELALWASEPLFSNPTAIDIDHKGRVWVCEAVNYRQILRNRPVLRPEGDRILILEDSQGTGKADKVTVFAQAPYIQAPLGIVVAKEPSGPGYKVYVCQSPDILLFEDKDGDGKADGPPKKFLSGFGGIDHDHGVHGLIIGPDGKFYFSVGDQGVKGLKDKNGKVWTTNQTDCRAGTIWRCDLDGSNLELIAHNFRNQYEPCVDSFGTIFVSDNDDDGNQQTRICYVMPGGNYGYWPRGPGQTHWHEEQPGVVPKVLRTYFGSPTGMCVYEGTLLPKRYWGQPLHTDAGPRQLRLYKTKPQGAGYEIDREDIVTSSDNWFRPSDVCVAPDGSVFISDWYDPGVGGHGMGDTTRGRIYRLAPKGHKYQVLNVDLSTKQGVTAALGSPNLAVRSLAMQQIRDMGKDQVVQILFPAASQKDDVWLRARAMWQQVVAHNRWISAGDPVGEASKDQDCRFKTQAIRLAEAKVTTDDQDLSAAKALTTNSSAAVRREFLLSLRRISAAQAMPSILGLARLYDGKDRFYLAAIGIAVGTDPKRRETILADFDKHFPEWNEKTANLIWELRPPSVLPRLEKLLADVKTPEPQRAQIVDILAVNDDPAAGRMLLARLLAEPSQEVRARILANLKLFLPGKWRDLRRGTDMVESVRKLLANGDTAATGLALAALAERSDLLDPVRKLALDDNGKAEVRQEAIKALGSLPFSGAAAALDQLTGGAEPGLRLAAVQALGQHLEGRRENPAAQPALDALKRLVVGKDQPAALETRQAALTALAGSRVGTQWLLQLQSTNAIPADLRADAGRLARNTPHQDLRNRALIAFPPPGRLDPKKLPSPAVLALRTGDVGRGKQVLAASLKNDLQCLKCHTVLGVGGSVGPDLSMIGKKASRENLFESILQPSKAVADQFVNWQIATTRGVVLNGLLVEETADAVTLRDANGKDTRIAKRDIESRDKAPVSLMPDNVIGAIAEDELIDLVEYLTTLKSPAYSPARWQLLGPFPNTGGDKALDHEFGPEQGIDVKADYAGKSGRVSWRPIAADGQGYFDLQAIHGKDSPQSVSYLACTIESPADQEARILLGTDDGAKLWVNGSVSYISRRQRAAVPAEDSATVKLRKGRNDLLLKIENGNNPHGFFLTILSDQELAPPK